jgi:aminoglycoside/choline kinase family phosphotransferase
MGEHEESPSPAPREKVAPGVGLRLGDGLAASQTLTFPSQARAAPPSPAVPERDNSRSRFLSAHEWGGIQPALLAGDASFRTYYRLRRREHSIVLMDAPPPQEDVAPYIAVAAVLRGLGLSAPVVLGEDRANGFLLIEDFGDDTYTRLLARGADEAVLYALAIDTLIALQRNVASSALPELPEYDEARLLGEAALLTDWYAAAVLAAPLPATARDEYLAIWHDLLPQAAQPGPTLVLRDYHVDNLMLLPQRPGIRACGLLDFQDAVIGPASYDLVSLLRDARRDVSPAVHAAMTKRYLAAFPGFEHAAFTRSAAILAAQRNCKIIGIFTRLWRRDGKPDYLAHIPRLWRLLAEDLRHPALAPIAEWLDRHLPPHVRQIPPMTA